jgi:hypothetical protein
MRRQIGVLTLFGVELRGRNFFVVMDIGGSPFLCRGARVDRGDRFLILP